jgi:hypothetical protein
LFALCFVIFDAPIPSHYSRWVYYSHLYVAVLAET